MNQYIASTLKVDLAQVITRLAQQLIEVTDLWQLITDSPENEEDLMDFVDREDCEKLIFVMNVIKSLTQHLDPQQMIVLRKQLVALSEEEN